MHGIAQGNLLGNIAFFLQVPPPGRSPNIKVWASRDENCTLIIQHLGTGEYRGFLLALPAFLPSAIFLPKLGSVGLCSKIGVLCIWASPVKQGYYAQNYARLEV